LCTLCGEEDLFTKERLILREGYTSDVCQLPPMTLSTFLESSQRIITTLA